MIQTSPNVLAIRAGALYQVDDDLYELTMTERPHTVIRFTLAKRGQTHITGHTIAERGCILCDHDDTPELCEYPEIVNPRVVIYSRRTGVERVRAMLDERTLAAIVEEAIDLDDERFYDCTCTTCGGQR